MKKLVFTALISAICIVAAWGAIFTEGFGDIYPPSFPSGWAVEDVNGDANAWETVSYYSNLTPNSLCITYNSSMAMDDWVFSSGLSLTGGVAYVIDFYYRVGSASYPEKLELKCGDSQTSAGMTIPIVDLGQITNPSWQKSSSLFRPAVDGTYYFGWHGYSDADMFYLAIDDISIDLGPSVISPTALTATEITAFSAKLGWTENNSPAATGWEVVYGASGFDPDLATPVSVGTNPYVLSGLSPDTSYEWYVRAVTGSKDISAWSLPAGFQTIPDVAFYWIEDVETESIFNWSTIAGSGNWGFMTDTSAWGYGSQSFVAPFYSISGSSPFSLVSPEFNISAYRNTTLKFDYAYATYMGEVDRLEVWGILEDNTSVLLQNMPGGVDGILNTAGSDNDYFIPSASQWATISIDLPPEVVKLKYAAISAYGNNLFIDNIRILGDYYYPNGTPVVVGDETITVTGGNANNGTGLIPDVPNTAFVAAGSYSLTLIGAGPWTITIETDAPWGAYYKNGQWYSVPNVGGVISFTVTGAKDAEVPVVLGNVDPTLPVELSSFTAIITTDLCVKIAWVAQSETNHSGYNILRAENTDITTALKINPALIDNGIALGTQLSYSYTDQEAYSNMVYYYWLESIALDGASEFYGPLSVTIGDPSQDPLPPAIPIATKLLNAFPNPFNPNTNIRYSLKEADRVNINIYNLKGQLVRSFNAEHANPGYYQVSWDGKDQNGKPAASGIYMYRMTSGKYSEAKKMILAK